MIPYGRQSISQEDIDAVRTVLESEYLTQGPAVKRFEEAVTAYLGSSQKTPLHAVAMNSATSALHIACIALGVEATDHVWTCANSFAASANCALYCGAVVDFIDIDPVTLNMDVQLLGKKLEQAQKDGTLPKIVIPVDFAGRSADLKAINSLAKQYGFAVLEDASHAIGGIYQGNKIGAHGLADITVFSFHPVKIITTAEGGMAVTQNADLAARMEILRTHGITRDSKQLLNQEQGAWYYEQISLGYNYRMTDIHAALGCSQLKRIDSFIDRRHSIYLEYETLLAPLVAKEMITLPSPDEANCRSALHLYPIQISKSCGANRRLIFDAMRAAGIGVNVHYLPIYWHPYYRQLGFEHGLCPHAENYYESALSLPMHAELTLAQQKTVVKCLEEAIC
jgi:UDP-4-amino-4,6-dideoxy-N-acetyl-beta-L-altrosamine transaminase